MALRLVFMGTPDFAVPTLTELVGRGLDVAAVYTRAPKPAGRGMALQPSPVERTARQFGLPVLTPRTLRDEAAQAAFAAHRADAAVVVAYGLILPRPVLDAVPLGCFNVHASLLPRWRGAAPINRAVMAGDADTGIAIMRMDEGLDTGPIAMAERIAIGPDMTAGELHDVLAPLGADLMLRALSALERGALALTPQPEEATYAPKIDKAETRIDWSKPASAVHNQVRGLSPFPGAWTPLGVGKNTERLKVLRTHLASGHGTPGTLLEAPGAVACGDGAVRLLQVQRAGKEPMDWEAFARGARLNPGQPLA